MPAALTRSASSSETAYKVPGLARLRQALPGVCLDLFRKAESHALRTDVVYLQPDILAADHVLVDVERRLVTVVGPSAAVHMLSRLQGIGSRLTRQRENSTEEVQGARLGPLTNVTLDRSSRGRAGIPLEAEFYAFIYPHDAQSGKAKALVNEVVGAASPDQHPANRQHDPASHLMLFILGGFVYFDKDRRMLRINGLSFRQTEFRIFVDGPYDATPQVGATMTESGRLQPSAFMALLDAGVIERGWINPRERPGDTEVIRGVEHPSGAFLCKEELADGTDVFRAYRVLPTAPPARKPEGLLKAFVTLSMAFNDAANASKALSRDLAEFERSGLEKWIRAYGIIVPTFYAVGCLLYGYLEGWGVLDVVYFLTTTLTTVGYGDLTPTGHASRLVTCFYAPLGTIVVMSGILTGVHWIMAKLSEWMLVVAALVEHGVTYMGSVIRICMMSRSEQINYKRISLSHPELRHVDHEPWSEDSVRASAAASAAGTPCSRSAPGTPFSRLTDSFNKNRKSLSRQISSLQEGVPSLKQHLLKASVQISAGAYIPIRRGKDSVVEGLSLALQQRKKKLGTTGQYLHAALGPALLAIIGATLTYFVHSSWDTVDAFYWTVITMTTVGYGDLLPDHWFEKLFAIFFMPMATAALAATVSEFSEISRQSRIARGKVPSRALEPSLRCGAHSGASSERMESHRQQLSLIADKVLMVGVQVEGSRRQGKEHHEVRMSRTDSLNEDQFIVSVLVAEGLVNERMVQTIRSKYHGMLDEHNKVYAPAGCA